MLHASKRTTTARLAACAVALSLCAAGCSSGGGLANCYIGDRAAPAEAVLVNRLPSGAVVDVTEGGAVGLEEPPQGGKTLFAGVRARNIGCVLDLDTSLIDEATGMVVAFEGRPVVLKLSASGYGEPERPAELDNYANLPACPNGNQRIRHNLFGRSYRLQVMARDRFGKTVTVQRRVVPHCAEPNKQAQCECECGACYVLGDACAADGGGPVQPLDAGVCPTRDGG